MSELHVLVFAPHPDDAEICCGGFLSKMAHLGYQTGIVDLTRGELSSQGDLETRVKETAAATQVLGLAVRENLELPDGAIGCEAPAENGDWEGTQLTKVVSSLRRLKPEIVVIPYWDDRHPDHIGTSELLSRAIFYSGLRKFMPALGAPHVPHQTLHYAVRYEHILSFVCDITEVYETKKKAIQCYRSQVLRDTSREGPATLLSNPLVPQWLEARDKYYGAMIGREYGEAYLSRSILEIEDPVRQFRLSKGADAFIFPQK